MRVIVSCTENGLGVLMRQRMRNASQHPTRETRPAVAAQHSEIYPPKLAAARIYLARSPCAISVVIWILSSTDKVAIVRR